MKLLRIPARVIPECLRISLPNFLYLPMNKIEQIFEIDQFQPAREIKLSV